MAEFRDYVANVQRIWELEKPQFTQTGGAESVYQQFRTQYEQIRDLAAENKAMVRTILMPYFKGEKPVGAEAAALLETVCEDLGEIQNQENFDHILELKCRRLLLAYYRQTGDRRHQMEQLLSMTLNCYFTAFALNRSSAMYPDALFYRYNDEGIAYVEELESYLAPERFETLSDEEKRIAFQAVGYRFMFQKGASFSAENLRYKVDCAVRALECTRSPYYQAAIPGFPWERYERYCLYYIAMCAEYYNWEENDSELMAAIRHASDELERLYASGQEVPGIDTETLQRARMATRLFQHEISSDTYLQFLFDEYNTHDCRSYDSLSISEHLLVPGKIQDELIRRRKLGWDTDAECIGRIYWQIIDYTRSAPHDLTQALLLNYLQGLMSGFLDVKSGPTFSEMAQTIMANCSASTMIHSRMVGTLAQILCRALITLHPEMLIGVCGCESAEEVTARCDEILTFIGSCGLFHDLGKLAYLDIVGIIYRDFFDEEFDAIKRHPVVGWKMLRKHQDTAPYAMVALGHHRWYNETGGYPEEYHRAEDPHPIITDLIAIADCLDAATDTTFRSYNAGITLETYAGEVRAGAGTRYAPVGAELLELPSVQEELRCALSVGREQAYRTVWSEALGKPEQHA